MPGTSSRRTLTPRSAPAADADRVTPSSRTAMHLAGRPRPDVRHPDGALIHPPDQTREEDPCPTLVLNRCPLAVIAPSPRPCGHRDADPPISDVAHSVLVCHLGSSKPANSAWRIGGLPAGGTSPSSAEIIAGAAGYEEPTALSCPTAGGTRSRRPDGALVPLVGAGSGLELSLNVVLTGAGEAGGLCVRSGLRVCPVSDGIVRVGGRRDSSRPGRRRRRRRRA